MKKEIFRILAEYYNCQLDEERIKEAVTASVPCRPYAAFTDTAASVGCHVFNSSREVKPEVVSYSEPSFLAQWLVAVEQVQMDART